MRSRTNSFTAVFAPVLLSLSFFGPMRFADGLQNYQQIPTITVDTANQNSAEPYRLGQDVRIKVTASNETDQPITLAVINQYAQNRPKLFRNGKPVGYRSETAKLVRERDDDEFDLAPRSRTDFLHIQPYSSSVINVLNLTDWYGPLKLGSYRLTNRYRLTIGGPWSADSKALSFEVKQER